jgi:hypothetical protein
MAISERPERESWTSADEASEGLPAAIAAKVVVPLKKLDELRVLPLVDIGQTRERLEVEAVDLLRGVDEERKVGLGRRDVVVVEAVAARQVEHCVERGLREDGEGADLALDQRADR